MRTIIFGLRRLFRRAESERELNDEVAHYIELATDEYVRAGLARSEASRRARLDFAGVDSAKEAVRDAGWDGALDALRRDVGFALRGLRRNPAFTAVAVATLMLGIGATTAMFSVVDAVLLRPLPYRDPSRLVLIHTDDVRRGLHEEPLAYRTLQDIRARTRSLEDVGYFNAHRSAIVDGTQRVRTRGAFVSGNLFSILGAAPRYGRFIQPADERSSSDVAVISHALWLRRYGGDSSVIGTVMRFDPGDGNEGLFRIIGVMPATFYFPDKATEVWIPPGRYSGFDLERDERFAASARRWTGVARLAARSTFAGAVADIGQVSGAPAATYVWTAPDFPGFAVRLVPMLDHVAGPGLQSALLILLGAVTLVLLVAGANISNLLLARGASRRRELAIRRAIGADRGRLARQLLVESMALAGIGGSLGVALALISTGALRAAMAARLPRIDELVVDWRILAFAIAMTVVAGLVFGIMPALRVSAGDASEVLAAGTRTSGGRRHRQARGMLVVAECAMAVVLLAGAGLLLRSLARLRSVDAGFDARGVLSLRVDFAPGSAPDVETLTARLAAIPSVESVGWIDDMFITGKGNKSIAISGRDAEVVTGELNEGEVSPEFFRTMRVPVVRGRALAHTDVAARISAAAQRPASDRQASLAEPVVVNQTFARRFFANADPVGARFRVDPAGKSTWYTIVGVVGDIHRQGLERPVIPEYFRIHIPSPRSRADLLVRTGGDPLAIAESVRRAVSEILPLAVVSGVTTPDEQLGEFAAERDFQTALLALFAGLAVVLAAIGIYGVAHYAVVERTTEIGVRVALGASPRGLTWLVVRQGMTMPLVGMGLGAIGALGATRLLDHLLFGVGATDAAAFVGALGLLLVISFVACMIPARRAARVDPMTALRRE